MTKDNSAETYRILWLRTFHHSVAMRADFGRDGTGTLTVKVPHGADGYEPGSLMTNSTCQLRKLCISAGFQEAWFAETEVPLSLRPEMRPSICMIHLPAPLSPPPIPLPCIKSQSSLFSAICERLRRSSSLFFKTLGSDGLEKKGVKNLLKNSAP